jgi:hypothetical protein
MAKAQTQRATAITNYKPNPDPGSHCNNVAKNMSRYKGQTKRKSY